jgi:hypothetical protein
MFSDVYHLTFVYKHDKENVLHVIMYLLSISKVI